MPSNQFSFRFHIFLKTNIKIYDFSGIVGNRYLINKSTNLLSSNAYLAVFREITARLHVF